MYSIVQTFRSGRKRGQAPIEEYQWKNAVLGRVGIKRVETKRFIRFEHLGVKQNSDHYWYWRRSHWFIRFPFCKNDKLILIANILFTLIFLLVLSNLMVRLQPLIFQAILSRL